MYKVYMIGKSKGKGSQLGLPKKNFAEKEKVKLVEYVNLQLET